ncbi:MAG TPA: hydrogenase maturation nickel metallochaperone HypA [Blastocatellia bacterium]|nr:hydrogenase maturation nickel metallochaperone HypA [Blastocatellia bacterium]
MHELSIALSIVEMACGEAESRGGVKIDAVHLQLGQLSGVVKEALLFSYDLACEGTRLEGSRLVIEEIAPVAYCPACRTQRALDSTGRLCCSVCGGLTPEILKGKELEVVALEISDEHATASGRG